MFEKMMGGRVCRTELTVILQNFRMCRWKNTIETIEFCVTKYFLFLQKKCEKKRGHVVQKSLISYKISTSGDKKIQFKQFNSALQEYFQQKMLQMVVD